MSGILIPDGFTLEGLIPARPGLHGDVRFKYRPARSERVIEYLKADKGTPAKDLVADVKLLLDQLVSWEVEAPLDEPTLRMVAYPALQTMVNHVCGYSATDWKEREGNS